MAEAIIVVGCTWIICSYIQCTGFIDLVVKAFICCIVPNLLFILVNIKNRNLKKAFELIKSMSKKI